MNIKSPLLWIGLALCVVVVVAMLFLGNRSHASSAIGVPVARYDIPPGTVITKDYFMLEQWSGVQPGTLDQYVTRDEFSPYVGAVTVETVHAGFPLGKAQVVQAGEANPRIRRLSLMVQEEGVAMDTGQKRQVDFCSTGLSLQ